MELVELVAVENPVVYLNSITMILPCAAATQRIMREKRLHQALLRCDSFGNDKFNLLRKSR